MFVYGGLGVALDQEGQQARVLYMQALQQDRQGIASADLSLADERGGKIVLRLWEGRGQIEGLAGFVYDRRLGGLYYSQCRSGGKQPQCNDCKTVTKKVV